MESDAEAGVGYPRVIDEHRTVEALLAGRSIARFGDGELELIRGNPWFSQTYDPRLSAELAHILRAPSDVCITGIMNFNRPTAKEELWSKYRGSRAAALFDANKIYYSSFITRPDSIPWINTNEYWSRVSRLWQDRSVLLVRGGRSSALRPETLNGAKSVSVIHGPELHAYSEIDRLEQEVLSHGKVDVVMICLGPTATCLAWRLAHRGIQALDLGHLGMFYRRFRRGEPVEGRRKEGRRTAKPITLVLSYYENPNMLAAQLDNIRSYDAATKEALRLLLVDDGSPTSPALIENCPVPFKQYRSLVDVAWNSDFCRNLAASQAETEWLLLTDMDHLVPPETVSSLVHGQHSPERAYLFSRVTAPKHTPYKPHLNSWFMTRTLFDRVGGYDERLSGWYGSDMDFYQRVQRNSPADILPDTLVRVPRSVVADASTTTYARSVDHERLRRLIEERGQARPARLTFPWERVR